MPRRCPVLAVALISPICGLQQALRGVAMLQRLAILVCVLGTFSVRGAEDAQPLDPGSQKKFQQRLPKMPTCQPCAIDEDGVAVYNITAVAATLDLGLRSPSAPETVLPTAVFGFNGQLPGCTFDLAPNTPIRINW